MSCVSCSEAHRGERAWRGGRPGPWPGYSCVAPPRGVTSPVTAAVAHPEAGPLARLLLRHVPSGEGHVARSGIRRPGPWPGYSCVTSPRGPPRPVTSGWVTSPSHGDPWSRRSRRSRRSRAATGPDLITAGTARFCRGSQRTQRRPRRPRPRGSGNHHPISRPSGRSPNHPSKRSERAERAKSGRCERCERASVGASQSEPLRGERRSGVY